ncbi:MAG: hypothetical protein JWP94_2875 [Mucilaginibacter sp.]|nr:hypothetical protein [Mucilaginibacter sp.]
MGQNTISIAEVRKHIGETVTVTDKVFSTKLITPSNITLFNLGGYYPNQLLTIMIPGADRNKFKGQPVVDYKGRTVAVTGKVIEYKGKPEIVITEPSQIKLVLTDSIIAIPVTAHD